MQPGAWRKLQGIALPHTNLDCHDLMPIELGARHSSPQNGGWFNLYKIPILLTMLLHDLEITCMLLFIV